MSDSEVEKKYLAMARDDVQVAKDLLQTGHLRAATSRAYYAMFYAATALLERQGLRRSKHYGVIAAFGELFVKTGLIEPHYGRMLHRAFLARVDSDYEPEANMDFDFVEGIVDHAADFVSRVERILHDDDRSS